MNIAVEDLINLSNRQNKDKERSENMKWLCNLFGHKQRKWGRGTFICTRCGEDEREYWWKKKGL